MIKNLDIDPETRDKAADLLCDMVTSLYDLREAASELCELAGLEERLKRAERIGGTGSELVTAVIDEAMRKVGVGL